MVDASGVQAALAVEAVEWAPADLGKLTIRVRGRWRRRRPGWRGQPMLVIEAGGKRYRFPAMPEPPSLAGAPPGSWQMTFSVPAALAPQLGGRIWLQLGLAIVPLPAPVGPPGQDPPTLAAPEPGGAPQAEPAEPPASEAAAIAPRFDAELLVDRRARTAELGALRARERQAEAETIVADLTVRVERLERELEHAHSEPKRLRKLLADRDQQRRAADQRAHAEQALRLELEEALEVGPEADRAQARIDAGELATAEARIRELEEELETIRRRADEAERVALAARPPAPAPPPSEPERPPHPEPRPFDLRQELVVAGRRPRAAVAALAPAGALATVAELRALRRERELVAARRTIGSPLPSALPLPAAGELELAATLLELRAELEQLVEIGERESAGHAAARVRVAELEGRVAELEQALRDREQSSARVYEAVHQLRSLLGQARSAGLTEPPPRDDPQSAAELEPERFDQALSRLRASTPREPEEADRPEPPSPAAPPPAAKPWLHPVLKRITAHDPDTAGRLLIALLPAQGAVYPAAIAYDLVLGERECVQVTLGDPPATPQIVLAERPRDPAEVAFGLGGWHAELAQFVIAGRLRRRLRRHGVSVSGDRRALAALTALGHAALSLDQLYDAGVRLDPRLTFTLAAAMVQPSWTVGERFTIAHEGGIASERATYLHVRRGEPLTVGNTPPLGPVATTVVCSSDLLLAVLAGRLHVDATIRGDSTSLLALLGWLERAQHG